MDEKKVEGQAQPQVSNAVNPAPSGNVNNSNAVQTAVPKTTPAQPTPTTAYHSAIPSKASQKIDPFAEQNAKRAAKKAANKKKAKTGIIVSVILIVIIVTATILAIFIITKPKLPVSPITLENGSTEEITAIQNQAQQVYYNDNPDINLSNPDANNTTVIDQLFAETLNSPSGRKYPNQVLLAQLIFYSQNSFTEQAQQTIDKIDPEQLDKEQQAIYYNYCGAVYSQLDNNDKAAEFYNKASQIRFELGGLGG